MRELERQKAASTAVVTGAGGQDGYYLTRRLLDEGWTVYALLRRRQALDGLGAAGDRLHVEVLDLLDRRRVRDLIESVQPRELYNLAGESSVSRSFAYPMQTWETNANVVVDLLEVVRAYSPDTRFYQASSSDMFGWIPGGSVVHDESSRLEPQSPYAAAKAAAHLICRSYRDAFDLRIACGILFNHESRRRSERFLSQKVVNHLRSLSLLSRSSLRSATPLRVGNLNARRDWGFAPDYVDGIVRILRQITVRADALGAPAEPDEGRYYRDYVVCTGKLHAVWELVDRAFALAGFDLDWDLEGDDPRGWKAHFRASGTNAVVVDPALLRPADPLAIAGDASRARRELGWHARAGLDVFLKDMLGSGLARRMPNAVGA